VNVSITYWFEYVSERVVYLGKQTYSTIRYTPHTIQKHVEP